MIIFYYLFVEIDACGSFHLKAYASPHLGKTPQDRL